MTFVLFMDVPVGEIFADTSDNLWRKLPQDSVGKNAVLVKPHVNGSAPGGLYEISRSTSVVYPVSESRRIEAQRYALNYVNTFMQRFGFNEVVERTGV